MKQLKCTDACPEGVPTCEYVISAQTEDEIIDKMTTHASIVHAEIVGSMSEETMKMWIDRARKKITNV